MILNHFFRQSATSTSIIVMFSVAEVLISSYPLKKRYSIVFFGRVPHRHLFYCDVLRGGCTHPSYPLKKRYSIIFFGKVPHHINKYILA
jgi:hypothetical protein